MYMQGTDQLLLGIDHQQGRDFVLFKCQQSLSGQFFRARCAATFCHDLAHGRGLQIQFAVQGAAQIAVGEKYLRPGQTR